MEIRINRNETVSARRRLFFQCYDVTDGVTPETGESGGQPQISLEGASWTNTGIGTLVAVGNGRYYSELTQGVTDVANTIILSRYKSVNTTETIGSTGIIDTSLGELIWGSVARTLTYYGGGTTASEIWSYPTRTVSSEGLASSVWEYENRTLTSWRQLIADFWNAIPEWFSKKIEQISESDYYLYRGVDNTISFISSGSISGSENVVFSVKNSYSDNDDKSIIRIEFRNGLVIMNGGQYPDSVDGSIVILDETSGDFDVSLKTNASKLLIPSQKRVYDIKAKIGNEIKLISRGKIDILPDVTNSI
jgi:hypothetical protein